jgi:hypothetical protein
MNGATRKILLYSKCAATSRPFVAYILHIDSNNKNDEKNDNLSDSINAKNLPKKEIF